MQHIVHRFFGAIVGLFMAAVISAAEAPSKNYRIPAGDAATTLKTFAEQSGEQIVYLVNAVRGVMTKEVDGKFTAKDALNRMLAGTELAVVQDEKSGALTVNKPVAVEPKNALSRRADAKAAVARSAKDEQIVKLDDYTVTGTRIRGLPSEADISQRLTITRLDIERAGVTSLGELSRLIPQANSEGSFAGMGFGGQSAGGQASDGTFARASTVRTTFNLRGLGSKYTLVLVNGRRLPRTGIIDGSEAEDVSGIPVASIERVEVLLAGASAIYGSDAVGGVVNIITKRSFSGGELSLSYENTFASDTAVRTASLNYGVTRGKIDLFVSASVQDRNAFAAVDRYFSASENTSLLGGSIGPDSVRLSFSGNVFATGAGIVQSRSGNFAGLTTPYVVIPDGAGAAPLPASAYVGVTGNNFGVPQYTGDRLKYMNLISPQHGVSGSFRLSYQLNSHHTLFIEGRASSTETKIEGLPVSYNNRLGTTSAPIPANYPGNPFGVAVRIYKTFWELGPIQGKKTAVNSANSISTGARGSLPFGDWRYDLGLDFSRSTSRDKDAYGAELDTAAFNSLVAAQKIVLFYDSRTQQPNDLGMLRSLLLKATSSERNLQRNFSATADGSIWTLPGGTARMAVGGESRWDEANTSKAQPDAPGTSVNLLGTFKRTVNAGYAEVRVPVVGSSQKIPLVSSFDVSAAARYDSYSDIGGDLSPGYGVLWRPAGWLLFRASRNYAFRAPELQALYRPLDTTATRFVFSTVLDPLRGNQPLPFGAYPATIGGNVDLKPEHSISDNVGIMIEPPFKRLKGFSLSVDYQLIHYRDQLNSSVAVADLFQFFPSRVQRGATLPGDPAGYAGVPVSFDVRPVNISQVEVQTVDYLLGYRKDTPIGSFDAKVALTDYVKYTASSVPGAVPVDRTPAFPSRMTWQTFWSRGPYGFGIGGFYQEKQYADTTRRRALWGSATEWNAQLTYNFDRHSSGEGVPPSRVRQWLFAGTKLSCTVNNVFNREPPHSDGQAGFVVTDPRMARYIISLKKAF